MILDFVCNVVVLLTERTFLILCLCPVDVDKIDAHDNDLTVDSQDIVMGHGHQKRCFQSSPCTVNLMCKVSVANVHNQLVQSTRVNFGNFQQTGFLSVKSRMAHNRGGDISCAPCVCGKGDALVGWCRRAPPGPAVTCVLKDSHVTSGQRLSLR